jgi:hypothetical protein
LVGFSGCWRLHARAIGRRQFGSRCERWRLNIIMFLYCLWSNQGACHPSKQLQATLHHCSFSHASAALRM